MASYANQAADVVAAIQADKPIILSDNYVDSGSDLEWRQGGSFAAGSDETDADYPTTRLYDGFTHLATRPDAQQNTWYLIMDLKAASCNSVAIWLRTTSATTLSFQTADDNAFTTNLTTLATWSISSSLPSGEFLNTRRASFSLDDGSNSHSQVSTLRYARWKFTGTAILPQVTECWVADGIHARQNPSYPWPVDYEDASVGDFVSDTLRRKRYVQWARRKRIAVDFPLDVDARISEYSGFFSTQNIAAEGFVWSDAPNDDENRVHLMKLEAPISDILESETNTRTARIVAVEQGPFYAGEDAGI